MATFNSAVYTSQTGSAGKSLNAGILLDRDTQGKQRAALVSYTTLGTEAANDLIQLCTLPAGAKVLAFDSVIATTASVGTGVTVRVGDQTTANRWAGTIDISAGGVFNFTATLGTEVVTPVAITGTGDNIVTAKFVAVTSITASKVLTFFITYVLP